MAEEYAMDKSDNEDFENVIKLNEDETSEDTFADETTDEAESTELEVTQQPNAVFRRALLGGYKTVDVDKYIEQTKELLQSAMEENKHLKVKIDEMRTGSITMKTALSSAMKMRITPPNASNKIPRAYTTICPKKSMRYAYNATASPQSFPQPWKATFAYSIPST